MGLNWDCGDWDEVLWLEEAGEDSIELPCVVGLEGALLLLTMLWSRWRLLSLFMMLVDGTWGFGF